MKAQILQFKCMVKSDCSDTLILLKNYILKKDTAFYKPGENAICTIPEPGTYYLTPTSESSISFSIEPVPIKIDKLQLTVDTLEGIDLYEIIILESKEPNANKYQYWKICGQPANGIFIDNTITGRTEGKFKNGRAIETIKSYNKSGELTFIAYYRKDGKHLKDVRTEAFYRGIKK
jgi:hypothetical protein